MTKLIAAVLLLATLAAPVAAMSRSKLYLLMFDSSAIGAGGGTTALRERDGDLIRDRANAFIHVRS
jgi:hypothetical protein